MIQSSLEEVTERLNTARVELEKLQNRLPFETGETLQDVNRRCGVLRNDIRVCVSQRKSIRRRESGTRKQI